MSQMNNHQPTGQEDILGEGLNLSMKPLTAAARLRAMLADPDKIIVGPGVYDGFTARMALKNGFDCMYMTGAGTSISRLGMADLGLATMNDMKENAEMIANLDPTVPVIADADTGYGGSINIGRTVAKYIQAGVAGFHLEDQVVNKKCGHLKGKEIVSEEEYLSRIRAAVNMRKKLSSDIVIIARTDALQSFGFDFAVARLKAAIAVGADVAFLEAIETKEQAVEVCTIIGETPVMYGMVQGSSTPQITVKEAQEIGFKIIIYAGLCLGPVYISVMKAMKTLKGTGDVEKYENAPKVHEVFDVCGLTELIDFDLQASRKGGDSETK
jgi:2-methylisocitrate lyase-like PEP mutase family enzyme